MSLMLLEQDEDEDVFNVHTLLLFGVTFYNTQLNIPADPLAVSLFVEDPNFVVTQIASSAITRSGVGAYSATFLPTMPGVWRRQWQGTGNVTATSKAKRFLIVSSDMILS